MGKLKVVTVASFITLAMVTCNVDSGMESVNLDDTFFPMDPGYSWTYEQHVTVADVNEASGEFWTWEDTDTFTVAVDNVVQQTGGWRRYEISGGYFEDVGNQARVFDDQVMVFGRTHVVPVVPDPTHETGNGMRLSMEDDKLVLSAESADADRLYYSYTTRKRGVGVVSQSSGYQTPNWHRYEHTTCRLLYFCKGVDTIWYNTD